MRKQLSLIMVGVISVSLIGCSKNLDTEVVNINVTEYNSDITNFVNIVYNGNINSKLVNIDNINKLTEEYKSQNNQFVSVVNITDKMEQYVDYLEYRMDTYIYEQGLNSKPTDNNETNESISDEFVDNTSDEELAEENRLAELVTSINKRIDKATLITDEIELVTEVHSILEEYNSLPNYAKAQTNIKDIEDVVNVYGSIESSFDLEQAIKSINNRGNRFDADEDYSSYPDELESSSDIESTESEENTEPEISSHDVPIVSATNVEVTQNEYIEITDDWYTECIELVDDKYVSNREKIAKKIGSLNENIIYENKEFKLDISKLDIGLNNITLPGGYTLEIVRPQSLSKLKGVEEYKYELKDFIYWDNGTFKVRVISKFKDITLTGTYKEDLITFDNVSGLLPHMSELSISWSVLNKN